jgi:hypothetical protein
MHVVAERLVFVGDDRGFLKKGVKTYLMEQRSPLTCQHLFVCFQIHVVYGVMCHCQRGVNEIRCFWKGMIHDLKNKVSGTYDFAINDVDPRGSPSDFRAEVRLGLNS